jgi:hypothetical protein
MEAWPCLRWSSVIACRWQSAGAGKLELWRGGGEGGRRGCTGPTVEMEPRDLIDVNGEA